MRFIQGLLYLRDRASFTHSVRCCSTLQSISRCGGEEKNPCPCCELNESEPAHSPQPTAHKLRLFAFFISFVAKSYILLFLLFLILHAAGCDWKKPEPHKGFQLSVRFVLDSFFMEHEVAEV